MSEVRCGFTVRARRHVLLVWRSGTVLCSHVKLLGILTVLLGSTAHHDERRTMIVGNWAPDFDQIQFNCPTLPTSYLGNISTRSLVQMGDNVMIGGFIVLGTQAKNVIIRAMALSSASMAFRVPWLIRRWNCTMALGL